MTKILGRAFCIIEEKEKFAAIGEIIRECAVFDDVPSRACLYDAVRRREEEMSTGVGHGVAIAHGKIPGIMTTRVALGFSHDGIVYDEINAEPVHFLFVIASSPDNQADYLSTVSALLGWMHDEDFRKSFAEDISSAPAERFIAMLSAQDFSSPRPQ